MNGNARAIIGGVLGRQGARVERRRATALRGGWAVPSPAGSAKTARPRQPTPSPQTANRRQPTTRRSAP